MFLTAEEVADLTGYKTITENAAIIIKRKD